jgi:hypothetical protein
MDGCISAIKNKQLLEEINKGLTKNKTKSLKGA